MATFLTNDFATYDITTQLTPLQTQFIGWVALGK